MQNPLALVKEFSKSDMCKINIKNETFLLISNQELENIMEDKILLIVALKPH